MPIRLLKPSTGPLGETFADHAARRPGYAFCGQDIGRRRDFDTATQDRRIIASHAGTAHVYEDDDYGKVIDLYATPAVLRAWNVGSAFTRYAHNAVIGIDDAAEVRAGTPMSVMGDTGNAFGIHLHHELWINGVQVDPAQYYITSDFAGITDELLAPDSEEDDDMTDLVYWVETPSTDNAIPKDAMYYQPCIGAKLVAFTDGKPFTDAEVVGQVEYQAFVAARKGTLSEENARAARVPISGDWMQKLIAARGLAADPFYYVVGGGSSPIPDPVQWGTAAGGAVAAEIRSNVKFAATGEFK